MPYYDIRGTLPISIAANPEKVLARLSEELHSIGGETVPLHSAALDFRIPLARTVTRGYTLQGVSQGQLEIIEAQSPPAVLAYRLATSPMRWFCSVFTVAVVLTTLIGDLAFAVGYKRLLADCASIPPGLLIMALLYLAGTAFVRHKYKSFVSRVLATAS